MSQESAYKREVRVDLTEGLHLRPLSQISKCAMQFSSDIKITNGEKSLNAKSTIDLLTLEATLGTELIIEANGEDAKAAVDSIILLFETGFLIEGENSTQ